MERLYEITRWILKLRQNRVQVLRLGSSLVLVSLLFTGSTSAQNEPVGPTKKPADSSADSATKTRARQVAKPTTDNSAESADAPSITNTEQTASPSSDNSPLDTLRDRISEATTKPQRTRLQLQLVDQLVETGKTSEALAELRLMIGEEGFDPTGFYNMGNRLARLGDADGAVEAYRKAIDQRKGNYSRALNNLGVVLLQQGRWDQSYEAFMSALRQEKFRYAEASYNLGRLYAARGETDLAVREWRRTLVIDSQHPGATRALSEAKGEGKIRIASAASVPDKVTPGKLPRSAATNRTLTLDQATFDLLQQARNARDRGRNEEAVQEYRNVLSRTGGYFPPANLELSFALITLKHNDEAITALLAVSTKDGARYPIAYYHLARLYESQGQLKLAEENYSRAVAAYAGANSQFLLDLSRVREKLGDFNGALSALEEYVKVSERAGHKPEWSDERLAQLRGKIAASSPASTKP